MMSKKQWFVLLCVYVIYLLLGASVFHEVESTKELREQKEDKKERILIEELLVQHYVSNEEHTQDEIFEKLSSYCGRPLSANMSEIDPPIRWDFYHSLFFVITVVSTIGYGNLAPTTTVTRIFMIFYAIVGMPMNGMLIINLGDYFGKSFLKLYHRWKTTRVQHALATLGLVGQVVLYLIPGFTFFIFIPSILIMVYEEWPYDVAVHYAFVTLTTIGFGDWVAGTTENGHGQVLYMVYKIFLLVWIISGLGYIFMVMGFVASGLRSKRLCAIEHKLAVNIKRTNNRIRDELRTMVNEYLLLRVKRVYREKFIYVPNKRTRSQSCPNLKMYSSTDSLATIARKRAFSTCEETMNNLKIARNHSDSDLERIDKERTFNPTAAVLEPGQFLLRVANALGNYESLESSSTTATSNSRNEGFDMFSSKEILASERKSSKWSIGTIPQRFMRPRAASECKTTLKDVLRSENNDLTWYGPAATKRLRELREQAQYEKTNVKSLPPFTPSAKPQTLFERLKKSLKSNKDTDASRNIDLEGQPYYSPSLRSRTDSCNEDENRLQDSFSMNHHKVLEETSIADFLRALTAISVPELPQDMFDTTSLTPPSATPKRARRIPIQSFSRRTSLIPFAEPSSTNKNRRFSLRPDLTGTEPPPPYYPPDTTTSTRIITKNRKFSLRTVNLPSSSNSLQRNVLKLKYPLPKDLDFTEPENKGGSGGNFS
ncbi:hypothetical protein RN001_003434 [Aquatica leii]|uniref:Potassium channel domain-containing protein n=1 Tax=Aquatica leii TaxID=1421715 RepID=A0AAN7QP40_9COLE|nr:hypothetical protein RN001_003434 [Aquatica leii]